MRLFNFLKSSLVFCEERTGQHVAQQQQHDSNNFVVKRLAEIMRSKGFRRVGLQGFERSVRGLHVALSYTDVCFREDFIPWSRGQSTVAFRNAHQTNFIAQLRFDSARGGRQVAKGSSDGS